MFPAIPVALTAAPATAAIVTTGLAPLFWVVVGLMAAAAVLIVREAWSAADATEDLPLEDVEPRVRLHVVPKSHSPALDAA